MVHEINLKNQAKAYNKHPTTTNTKINNLATLKNK